MRFKQPNILYHVGVPYVCGSHIFVRKACKGIAEAVRCTACHYIKSLHEKEMQVLSEKSRF
ncbi:hypothetical protein EW027_17935 [Aeribacillus pallidus]|nr:hypothetical protein EW027_17935 [Aeribacillus pallidus]